MRDAVIVGAVRSPVGKKNGLLRGYHAVELGGLVLHELLQRSHVSASQVDQVLLGCVSQVGEQGANVARQALLQAGFPQEVPGTSIDYQCGSSQHAVHLAAALIESGHADIVVAADGQEIATLDDLTAAIASRAPGDEVVLTVLRGGDPVEVTVTLAERP